VSDNQTGVTVTLKAGPGFESPWIVIHAESVADAKAQINQGEFAELAERTVAAAEFFRAAHNVKSGLAANEPQQAAPPAQQQSWSGGGAATAQTTGGGWSQQGSGQTQQQAPAQSGEGKQCVHGAMTFREGVGKQSGKPYKAFFCPAPKGSNQCSPEFVR
jgi:hypothetical protein